MKKKSICEVLFLTQGNINQASSRFRIYNYLNNKTDIEKTFNHKIMPLPQSGLLRRVVYLFCVAFQLKKYDVVVVQKVLFPILVTRLIRILVPRLVYDWDDALYVSPPLLPITRRQQKSRIKKLNEILKSSDTVICGNRTLSVYASKLCNDVRVIPTSVIYRVETPKKNNNVNVVVIGWIGKAENLCYLQQLTDVFNKLYEKYGERIKLRVVCDKKLMLDSKLIVENKSWSLHDEEVDILGFDIGIMPLEDTEWARGKCAFKLIQYMVLGIPSVGSAVGANSEVINHGVNGYLANNNNSWVDCISELIENIELRNDFGSAARLTIKDKYSLQVTQKEFMHAVVGE